MMMTVNPTQINSTTSSFPRTLTISQFGIHKYRLLLLYDIAVFIFLLLFMQNLPLNQSGKVIGNYLTQEA